MNLNHLRHLIALAEHQSFRKAADVLCLTQPAISRSIQALEEELQVKLIDRDGKRNTLTAYGAQVVDSARRIIFEATELQRGVMLLKGGTLGAISIGFGPTPAAILMAPFLIQMATFNPKVQLNVSRGSVGLLTKALRNEAIDIIAIDLRALTAFEDLQIEPLTPLKGGFICRAGHPLLAQAPISLEMLRQYPVVSTPLSDEITRALATDLGADAHPSRMITISSEDISGLLDVAEATDAIFFGVFATAKARIAAGKLHAIEVQPRFKSLGRYALVTMAGRSESPPLELFRSFVHTYFHD
jgi:DNA-binding transcriptional LysR family regulator